MLLHLVYFWLRDDLDDAERERFETGLRGLLTIDGLADGHIGTPADTAPRPVVDASYDYALVTYFADVAAHDRYQQDPVHQAFLETKPLWSRVQVYDTHLTASSRRFS